MYEPKKYGNYLVEQFGVRSFKISDINTGEMFGIYHHHWLAEDLAKALERRDLKKLSEEMDKILDGKNS